MTSLTDRKNDLLARRAELLKRAAALDEELDSHRSSDWEELATEREQDEVFEKLGQTAMSEVRAIDAAIARIDAGTFGICQSCGRPISSDRLDIMPTTTSCRRCALT